MPDSYPVEDRQNRGPVDGWQPEGGAVVIYWTLDASLGVAYVDMSRSCIYPLTVIQSYGGIAGFAKAADGGTLMQAATKSLSADPQPQPWDFAIDQSSYIVFVLQVSTANPWEFRYNVAALDFKLDEHGWFSDLHHVNGNSVDPLPSLNCKTCYFSAFVTDTPKPTPDGYWLNFVYNLNGRAVPVHFDPAIKNKGRPPQVVDVHFTVEYPTPFVLPGFESIRITETIKVLKNRETAQADM